jgi:hypothetical protein
MLLLFSVPPWDLLFFRHLFLTTADVKRHVAAVKVAPISGPSGSLILILVLKIENRLNRCSREQTLFNRVYSFHIILLF